MNGLVCAASEQDRLRTLRAYRILDTGADPRFDAITRAAARIFDVPVALISLIDADRLWFKSGYGPLAAGSERPRAQSFCNWALEHSEHPLVVEDVDADPRFAAWLSQRGSDEVAELGLRGVAGELRGVRFYAGVPLHSAEGHVVGMLCLLDVRPRRLSAGQLETLRDLGLAVTGALDLHRSAAILSESIEHHRNALELNPQIIWACDPEGGLIEIGSRIMTVTGLDLMPTISSSIMAGVHPDERDAILQRWIHSLRTGAPYDVEHRIRSADGGYRWFRAHAQARRGPDRAIVGWYGVTQDIDEQRMSQAQIEHLAIHDRLTGLFNRVQLARMLEREIARTGRGPCFALLHLDLDNFRAINDTLGNASGDELLCQVASLLAACLRDTDILARAGSDEFLVVQTDLDHPEAASLLAERILRVLAPPIRLDGTTVGIGVSIGIAVCPQDGTHAGRLLQNADLALSRAKTEARGSYRFYQSEMDEKQRTRQALKVELRAALDQGELELAYQPVVGLRSGRIEAFEALLRWRHPTRGPVPPDEFVPIAEATGLIPQIGRWVLETACGEAMRWPDTIRVAVNLSPMQFRQRDLVQDVANALLSSGLSAERLELEITESLPLLDDDANLASLRLLRALGVRIVLDDFGIGYSSLGYLQCFPFDKLKIDRSFVTRMVTARDARTIVRTVLRMARALGIATTAEGVETRQQLSLLRAARCDQVQGYLLSRPLAAAALPELLAQQPPHGRRIPELARRLRPAGTIRLPGTD